MSEAPCETPPPAPATTRSRAATTSTQVHLNTAPGRTPSRDAAAGHTASGHQLTADWSPRNTVSPGTPPTCASCDSTAPPTIEPAVAPSRKGGPAGPDGNGGVGGNGGSGSNGGGDEHATPKTDTAAAVRMAGGEGQTVLAIDIGTSSIKIGVIDEAGRLLEEDREHMLRRYADVRDWRASRWTETLARVLGRMQLAPRASAVAVSGNGPTIVPVDAEGRALDPVLMWLDGRAEKRQGERSFFLPKAAWLARHDAKRYERTRWLMSGPEYIDFVLTGEAVTITSTDEFAPYIWGTEAARRFGIGPEKLPPFVHLGEVIGRTTKTAAEAYNLPAGIPVVAGGSDFIMSLLGTAAVEPGRTCDRAGTSEGVNYCSVEPVDDPRTRCLPHPVAGYYNVAGVLSSTGTIFEWFREISGQKQRSYAEMLADIEAVEERRHIPWFFPTMHEGAAWEFSRGMFIELGAEHGPREMGRAVVESIGYAVREVIDVLGQNGCNVDELRVCGGQGRNEIWSQMKADMVGRSLAIVEVIDAELLGNACAAFVGLGCFDSVAEAAKAMVRIARRYEPHQDRLQMYEEGYHRYRDAYGRFRLALKECDLL